MSPNQCAEPPIASKCGYFRVRRIGLSGFLWLHRTCLTYICLMDFDLSDEQRAFAKTARAFAREEWLPQAPGWDERSEFPAAALRRAAELGFAGIYVGDE